MNNWMARAGLALLRRPDLWRTAVRVSREHAPDRWWAEKPHLPIPDRDWLEFRFETAFAVAENRPDPEQVIEYLEWAKSWKYL